ncbi:MAG TPA: hypothetical protein VFQ45_15960 [Longimicrobium sp.]|nr:hypothetical protein [Longimicrobium sp.]
MANGTPVANPGWDDIQGIFAPFRSQMMWRFNLGSYEDVAANAQIILLRIQTTGDMPPPPYPPLTDAQITTFKTWVNNRCPLTAPTTPSSATATPTLSAATPATSESGVGTAEGAVPQPAASRDRFRFR